ncbi:cell division protein FtsL [Oryzisolibacter propanilivorax]|uniref:Cell division protein FtsL n=1 Tax=Oryzisolibacter propanilivorax TaxID=1527607 RepID=A0A1G9RQ95_9BURK|nr:cell division protein FtsL [Oryzisolibacter propanilivorax]SDM25478.1 cell division protein FtsL [Oryzisolibacter propanilivorax]
MTRISLLLLVAVMGSAMAIVHTQYEARRLYTALHRALAESRQLESDHKRLQVERRAQATPLRIEALARDQLHMRMATPAITQWVTEDGQAVAMPVPEVVPTPARTAR